MDRLGINNQSIKKKIMLSSESAEEKVALILEEYNKILEYNLVTSKRIHNQELITGKIKLSYYEMKNMIKNVIEEMNKEERKQMYSLLQESYGESLENTLERL